jgi:hypothetical protein
MSRSLSSSQARGAGNEDKLCFSLMFIFISLSVGMQLLFLGAGRFKN